MTTFWIFPEKYSARGDEISRVHHATDAAEFRVKPAAVHHVTGESCFGVSADAQMGMVLGVAIGHAHLLNRPARRIHGSDCPLIHLGTGRVVVGRHEPLRRHDVPRQIG